MKIWLRLTQQQEIRDCCAHILTETWLNPPDDATALDGCGLLTAYKTQDYVMQRGGGLCVRMNNTLLRCSQRGWTTLPDVQCLMLRCRPFYLPENLSVFALLLFIFPQMRILKMHCSNCMMSSAATTCPSYVEAEITCQVKWETTNFIKIWLGIKNHTELGFTRHLLSQIILKELTLSMKCKTSRPPFALLYCFFNFVSLIFPTEVKE